MATISNTGKTVSLTFDSLEQKMIKKVVNSETVSIDYRWSARVIVITSGRRVISVFTSGDRHYITEPARATKYSKWPRFGRIDAKPMVRGSEVIYKLPETLPEPRQLSPRKKVIAKTVRKTTSPVTSPVTEIAVSQNSNRPTANVLIVISGKTLEFAVPTEKLLDMTLEMAHNGYSIKGS